MELLALTLLPALLGAVVGRWWLVLMLALPATTIFGQGVQAGVPTGPLAAMTFVPLAGATAGVAARRAFERARDYRRNGGMSISSSEISSELR